jgi:hypothetical protein
MASSIDVKKQTPHMIFNQYEWERKRGQADNSKVLFLFPCFFLTRGASSCCHQIPSSIFTSTTRLRKKFPCFFFLYVLLPLTFYNYDYCIANNLQQRWWIFF